MSIQGDLRDSQNDLRRVSGTLAEALSQFARLFQTEINLAKAEVGEKAKQAGAAIGMLVAAGLFGLVALILAFTTLATALIAAGWSAPLAWLAATILAAVIAGVLAAIGRNRLDARKLAPHETMHQLEKDRVTIKEMVR